MFVVNDEVIQEDGTVSGRPKLHSVALLAVQLENTFFNQKYKRVNETRSWRVIGERPCWQTVSAACGQPAYAVL